MLLEGDFKMHSPNNFKNVCKIQQEPLVVESVFSSVTPDFMSDFNVIFYGNLFLITERKMPQKIISCENLENFRKTFVVEYILMRLQTYIISTAAYSVHTAILI